MIDGSRRTTPISPIPIRFVYPGYAVKRFILLCLWFYCVNNGLPLAWAAVSSPQTEVLAAPADRFGFADVRRRAADLAAAPYTEQGDELPENLQNPNFGYDQYRDIRYRTDRSIWLGEGLPFALRFFHRGFLFTHKVNINLVENGEIKPVHYDKALFDFGKSTLPLDQLPPDLGFAGMQIFFPTLDDGHYNEVAAFLGASYFRAVGRKTHYGLSARGLAIDTGLPKGEEFPFFREFWIEKPDKDAIQLTVYALLDSPSVTGAFRFLVQPGDATVMDVKSVLFPRRDIQKIGIAPLTSMYYHGELSERFYDDYRPEVHDSDGLLLNFSSGEWLWRPLNNPRQLRINGFMDQRTRGFGLLQRDREIGNYQDLEAFYHQRPSAWVEPKNWGPGRVELVEIPTDAERNDNIVAYWTPEQPAKAGNELNFDYKLVFGVEAADKVPGARALTTRVGAGGSDSREAGVRKFMIDFVGATLTPLPPTAPVDAMVWISAGELRNIVAHHNPITKGWRVFFEMLPHDAETVEMRCYLRSGKDVLSETWNYQWTKK